MEWKKAEEEPEIGKSLWLYGIDSTNGHERFDVGCRDETYGVMSNHGPSMEVIYWAYCEKPKTGHLHVETLENSTGLGDQIC